MLDLLFPFHSTSASNLDKSTKKTFQNNIGREKHMYQSSVTQVECQRLQFHWGQAQQGSFNKLKDELSSTPVLANYDPQNVTMLSANASSLGLGAVLVQEQDNKEKKPVAYASRSMTSTEQRYAQIEKEALAITSACEKFNDYILGKDILTETDQKPLVPLFGSKPWMNYPQELKDFQ